MRVLVRYARCRGSCSAGLGLLITWLVLRLLEPPLIALPQYDEMVRLPLAVGGALVGAVLLARTLDSSMAQLEATAGRAWAGYRLGSAVLGLVGAGVVLGLALPAAEWGAVVLLRDLAGLCGLALATAALTGSQWAWTLPVGYAPPMYLVLPPDADGWLAGVGFLTQPGDSTPALLTALTGLVAGLALWTCMGAAGEDVRRLHRRPG